MYLLEKPQSDREKSGFFSEISLDCRRESHYNMEAVKDTV